MSFPKSEQGVALVTVLILLVVLMMLGVSSMQGTQMEERMAGNSWEQSRAFHGAETGLHDAVEWLRAQTSLTPSSDGSSGVYSTGVVGPSISDKSFSWGTATVYGTGTSGDASSDFLNKGQSAPRYVIESLGSGVGLNSAMVNLSFDAQSTGDQSVSYYSIWVIGYGNHDSSKTIINAIVGI